MASADSSSTRARLYAPTPLAESWGLVTNRQGSHHKRLMHRFVFVEQILRLCCGLLDAERAAQRLKAPGERKVLLEQLHGPTLGSWFQAAFAFAKAVKRHAPQSPLLALAERLADESSRLHLGLDLIIDLRNDWAHHRIDLSDEATCEGFLDQTREATQDLAELGELFLDTPIIVVERVRSLPGGARIAKIVSFVGLEPQVIEREGVPTLPERQPLMLTPDGRAVPLTPWVMFGSFDEPKEHLRILDQLDNKQAQYVRGDDTERRAHPDVKKDLAQPGAIDTLMGPPIPPDPSLVALWRVVVSPRQEQPPPPALVGYTLTKPLGRGASSAVWEATRDDDGRVVALKVLRPELLDSPERRARLQREYALLTRLQHRGVARVYTILPDTPHGPVLEMQRVYGRPLSAVVHEAPMRPADATRLCVELLNALAAVHAAKVVHRDLKPENILVQADGAPCIVDFGIAQTAQGERLTGTLDRLGSPGFAAPEQHRGDKVSGQADLYAVGKLLVWMCAGRHDAEGLARLPGALQRVVRRATQARPADRHPDAAALRAELSGLLLDGWDGPPVGVGDLLPGNLRLIQALGGPRAGVHLFRATHVRGGGDLAVLVSGGDAEDRRRFEETLAAASPATLRLAGCRGVHTSDDGLIVFAELHWKGAEANAARLFLDSDTPSSMWDKLPGADTLLAVGAVGAAAVGALALALFFDQELDTLIPGDEGEGGAPLPSGERSALGAVGVGAAAGVGAVLMTKALKGAPGGKPKTSAPAEDPPPPSGAAVLAQVQLIGLLLAALLRASREHHVSPQLWAKLCKTPLASAALLLGPESDLFTGPVGQGLSALPERPKTLGQLTKLSQPHVDVPTIRAAVQTVRALRGVFRRAVSGVSQAALAPLARRGPEAWEVLFVQGQTTTWVKALPLKG